MECSVPRGEKTDADLTIDEAEGEVLKRKCSQLEMPAWAVFNFACILGLLFVGVRI